MKLLYLFVISLLSFCCASSQKNSSNDIKKNIDDLRTLLRLSPEQAQKLTSIETAYAKKSLQLTRDKKYYESDLKALKNNRSDSYKKVLSREQFIKFQAIDKDLIKQVPVRFDATK